MNYYTKIPIWENTRRTNKLIRYRSLIPKYFDNLGYDDIYGDPDVGEKAQRIRQEINMMTPEIDWIVMAAGISPVMTHYPAPAVGGFVTNLDLITNLFNIQQYKIPPIYLLDIIDKAIGVYQSNRTSSLIRTFNPLFWIWLLLTLIASLPFKLLASAGFDTRKIQGTLIGKLSSFIFQLIVLISTILTIFQILGYTNGINVVRNTIDNHLYQHHIDRKVK